MEKIESYEILYIVHPDLESSIDKITDRVRSFIEKREGKVTYEELWGKRKLAYEIKKVDVGIYILLYFNVSKEALSKIERDLRLTEEIIRHMILKTPNQIKPSKASTEEEGKEIKKEKPTKSKKQETKTIKKPTLKKIQEKKESDAERMKKIDEKLGKILGEEDNKKERKSKPKREKK